ncbi:MAG: lysophospholipid acyltransferase family protein [Acidobacteriota bacterium]|jgi:lauroyl/myristoyl acyltransferase
MTGEAAAPPHAPRVGTLRRLLGPLHVTGVFWYRFHRFGATRPRWVIVPFLTLFTGFFFLFLFRIRGAIDRNLVPVLGPCGWPRRQVRIFRTLWSFAWCLTERYEQGVPGREVRTTVEGLEHWTGALASDEGFILATAHLGNWEVGSAIPATEEGREIHIVREEEMDPRAQRFVEQVTEEHAVPGQVTHFAGREPALGIALLAALRRGALVALQADRPRTRGSVTTTRMFGRPYGIPEGLLALARAAGVRVLPVFVFREGRLRYRVAMRPPVQVPRTEDREADFRAAAAALAGEIEWAIRRRPHQWFCFGDVWGGTDGAQSTARGT